MSEELTHYDVLGVEPAAGKDDIRAAYQERLSEVQADISREQGSKKPDPDAVDGYRREEARVRTAWQVLSDPYQRGRYDVTIETAGDGESSTDVEVVDDGVDESELAALTPRERAREQARRQREERLKNMPPRQTMMSTERPDTPASWPPGCVPPPPRARTMALLVDLFVLFLLFQGFQLALPAAQEEFFPKEKAAFDRVLDRIDARDERIDRLEEGDESNSQSEQIESLERANERDEERRDDLFQDMAPVQYGAFGVLGLLGILYLVPSSAISGRTLGKRLFWIRAVKMDGSPMGFATAFRRYGTVVLVTVLTFMIPILSLFGPIVVLFVVLSWPRNPNLQGMHDRFAKTIVVDG